MPSLGAVGRPSCLAPVGEHGGGRAETGQGRPAQVRQAAVMRSPRHQGASSSQIHPSRARPRPVRMSHGPKPPLVERNRCRPVLAEGRR